MKSRIWPLRRNDFVHLRRSSKKKPACSEQSYLFNTSNGLSGQTAIFMLPLPATRFRISTAGSCLRWSPLFVRGLQVPNAVPPTVRVVMLPRWSYSDGGESQRPSIPQYFPSSDVFSSPIQCAGGNYTTCNTTAVTVQIPVEPACIPTGFPDSCTTFSGPVTNLIVNARVTSQGFPFVVVNEKLRVLNTCDTIFRKRGTCTPSCYKHEWNSGIHLGIRKPEEKSSRCTRWAWDPAKRHRDRTGCGDSRIRR